MIVGNGMVAKAFSEDFSNNSEYVIFASGVSNSLETDKSLFLKESQLIEKTKISDKIFVYFSTTSIIGNKTKSEYIRHKEKMELQITSNFKNFLIVRLPQLVGHTKNQNTLINYLFNKILSGDKFIVQHHARRNLVDVEDVSAIVKYILNKNICLNEVINVGSPYWLSIQELIQIIETGLNKKSNYSIIDKGDEYIFDSNLSLEVGKKIGINFESNYVCRILKKYYPLLN
jgi:nucleoside-diphosphate-sugar epimerase